MSLCFVEIDCQSRVVVNVEGREVCCKGAVCNVWHADFLLFSLRVLPSSDTFLQSFSRWLHTAMSSSV